MASESPKFVNFWFRHTHNVTRMCRMDDERTPMHLHMVCDPLGPVFGRGHNHTQNTQRGT